MEKPSSKKLPILLIGITLLLLIGSAIACWTVLHNDQPEKIAEIYQDSELLYRIDLSEVTEPYTITITGDDGEENVVRVEPGIISMASASCPDGLCVEQGTISSGLFPIVCLPNRIRISIISDEEESYDVEVY